MSRPYQIASLVIIAITCCWWLFSLTQRHPVQWHYLAAGGFHFLMAIIINRQFTKKDKNYLGMAHVALMVVLFGYGYFFL